MKIKINKEEVYKAFYDQAVESLDWVFGNENDDYANYVNGMTDMVERIINIIDSYNTKDNVKVKE